MMILFFRSTQVQQEAETDGVGQGIAVHTGARWNFGINSSRPGMPMALLEDVLVPVYLYHRYQIEAVTKLIGGQQYTYALS